MKKGTKIKTHAKSFLNPHIERRCELKAPYLLHTEISLHIPFSDKVFKYMRLQRENRGCSRVNFKITAIRISKDCLPNINTGGGGGVLWKRDG